MKSTNRIYVSDLDGTLLRNDGSLSEFSRNVIDRLLQAGVNFTIASARSVVSIQRLLGDIPFKLPIIEFNGAFISDYRTGRHEIIRAHSREIAEDLYTLFHKRGIIPFISTFDGQRDRLHYSQIANDGMRWHLNDRIRAEDSRLQPAVDLRDCLEEQVVCFTLIDRLEGLAKVAAEVGERFAGTIEASFFENQYSPGWYWLTVSEKRASKDQAVAKLVEMLGLSLSDLTVFGDGVNDLTMFQMAGKAVAVANAIPLLRAHAQAIIGTNEDDSVVKYILSDLEEEKSDHGEGSKASAGGVFIQ